MSRRDLALLGSIHQHRSVKVLGLVPGERPSPHNHCTTRSNPTIQYNTITWKQPLATRFKTNTLHFGYPALCKLETKRKHTAFVYGCFFAFPTRPTNTRPLIYMSLVNLNVFLIMLDGCLLILNVCLMIVNGCLMILVVLNACIFRTRGQTNPNKARKTVKVVRPVSSICWPPF